VRDEIVKTDITVVGGGLAGVCAAVAAARLGCTVALVHNRPVLGGNSSSEVRVWVCGATAHGQQRYARETGIMGGMFLENQYRNIDGNPYLWDLIVLETVKAEPNIRLFLNTDVHEVDASGPETDRRIDAVTGWMMGSERRIRFESDRFLDCTGDGLIGFLAGAKFRIGREAYAEYQEAWAPEIADDITLGSTILFYTKDVGHPVTYVPPSFAKDIAKTSIPMRRVIRSGDSGCHYWWIEWGGELDTVHDNERIRDELWSVIYGIWDYIKNSGKFDSETMTLEWIGALPGKREYRRFVGDYVLNQNDIMSQRLFEDRVAFGGWSIDLHPPQGMYAAESGSKHLFPDGVYHIPFRSLYSENVANLLFAGRNVSATHVAFGTTRVMATCAVMGEAAGTGAALSVQLGASPRALHREHLETLQQTLLRQDASVLGVANRDPDDLARRAAAAASSALRRLGSLSVSSASIALDRDVGWVMPIDPELERVRVLVDAEEAATLRFELWGTGRPENYVPIERIASADAAVGPGEGQWAEAALPWRPERPQNAFVVLRAAPGVRVRLAGEAPPGVLAFVRSGAERAAKALEEHDVSQPLLEWSPKEMYRKHLAFEATPATSAYAPEKALDGYVRPYGGPHLWASAPLADDPKPWLELSWDAPQPIRELHLTFNDEVNEDLINLHHHRTPFETMPELAKHYRVEAYRDGRWTTLAAERDNRKRKRVHRFDAAVSAEKLRVVVEATNGCPYASIVEVRAYS